MLMMLGATQRAELLRRTQIVRDHSPTHKEGIMTFPSGRAVAPGDTEFPKMYNVYEKKREARASVFF